MKKPTDVFFLAPTTTSHGIGNLSEIGGGASIQLQLIPAENACKALGLSSASLSLHASHPEDLNLIDKPKICIAGKLRCKGTIFNQNQLAMSYLAAIARVKARDGKLIVLYSDHMENAEAPIRELYVNVLKLADAVVFPCKAIQKAAKQWINYLPLEFLIEDPWQTREQPFLNNTITNKIEVVWFGHESNLKFLLQNLTQLDYAEGTKRSLTITILTSDVGIRLFQKKLGDRKFKNLKFKFFIWDNKSQPQQLEDILGSHQFCIIPSDVNDKKKFSASHNRLVDAVRSGCITIASPIKSYLELSEVSIISNNISQGLATAIDEQAELSKNFAIKRTDILKKFSPEANHLKWKHCLEQVINLAS
ncbi:hypothetical protein OAE68_00260 [Synechococcus sp. AH-551-A10]|nr:hypothetical protein [Synechococcus sp. AH-551-A10]MDB4682093.1 hypothetical protein [Synechococcus sp. AH-551-A10]